MIWEYVQLNFSKQQKTPRSTGIRYMLDKGMLQELPPSAGQAQTWWFRGDQAKQDPKGERTLSSCSTSSASTRQQLLVVCTDSRKMCCNSA